MAENELDGRGTFMAGKNLEAVTGAVCLWRRARHGRKKTQSCYGRDKPLDVALIWREILYRCIPLQNAN